MGPDEDPQERDCVGRIEQGGVTFSSSALHGAFSLWGDGPYTRLRARKCWESERAGRQFWDISRQQHFQNCLINLNVINSHSVCTWICLMFRPLGSGQCVLCISAQRFYMYLWFSCFILSKRKGTTTKRQPWLAQLAVTMLRPCSIIQYWAQICVPLSSSWSISGLIE